MCVPPAPPDPAAPTRRDMGEEEGLSDGSVVTAENEENQASPLQISITDSTPTKSTLSSSEKAHTPRTPKELEHELDDCKRQLDELKNIVLRLSKKNSVGPEIAQETAS